MPTNALLNLHQASSQSLPWHLANLHHFKLGLRNSFDIDFRVSRHTVVDDDGTISSALFTYLGEVLPLVQKRAAQLSPLGQKVYSRFAESANQSFWEVYYRFQPLVQNHAKRYGVEQDKLNDFLARAILLFDNSRGVSFCHYCKKTLREAVKTLRGRIWASEYKLPKTAGRLMSQVLWLVDQETLRLGRTLSVEESERVVFEFLRRQNYRFSDSIAIRISEIARSGRKNVSLDVTLRDVVDPQKRPFWETTVPSGVSAGIFQSHAYDSSYENLHCEIDVRDEYEETLFRINAAIGLARFNSRDAAILLESLALPYDESIFREAEMKLSAGGLRNRRAAVTVRFMAAFHSDRSPRFKRLLHAEPHASRPMLQRLMGDLARDYGLDVNQTTSRLLNAMSLSTTAYRVSIAGRDRLARFLDFDCSSPKPLSGELFHKLKAALIDQDRQGCPCLRSD